MLTLNNFLNGNFDLLQNKSSIILRFPRVGDKSQELRRFKELGDHFFGDCVFKDKTNPFKRPWIGINFPGKKMGCLDCAKLFNVDPIEFGTKKATEAHIMGNFG